MPEEKRKADHNPKSGREGEKSSPKERENQDKQGNVNHHTKKKEEEMHRGKK
jgi:hypothetical protein